MNLPHEFKIGPVCMSNVCSPRLIIFIFFIGNWVIYLKTDTFDIIWVLLICEEIFLLQSL